MHLRFGPWARGFALSDRRDDFRGEVRDLVKAQQVKNASIVPVGAKGGSYPKRLPARGQPGYQEGGVEAYKTFLRGLLDITDNIGADGVIPPQHVIRWDEDDAYMVVAADKGRELPISPTASAPNTAIGWAMRSERALSV